MVLEREGGRSPKIPQRVRGPKYAHAEKAGANRKSSKREAIGALSRTRQSARQARCTSQDCFQRKIPSFSPEDLSDELDKPKHNIVKTTKHRGSFANTASKRTNRSCGLWKDNDQPSSRALEECQQDCSFFIPSRHKLRSVLDSLLNFSTWCGFMEWFSRLEPDILRLFRRGGSVAEFIHLLPQWFSSTSYFI